MTFKYLLAIQICFLIFIFAGESIINAQKTENDCKDYAITKNIPKDQIVCVSAKELSKRIVFTNDLYAPSTANLTRIKNKTVFIDVFVNKEGKVTEAVVFKGHPALTPIGVLIAYKTKFTPVKIDGKPKNMYGQLVLTWNPEKLDKSN